MNALLALLALVGATGGGGGSMVRIPAGTHQPLYGARATPVTVAAFRLDRRPVTRGEFLAFVRRHPAWQRGAVRAIAADRARYLADWPSPLDAGVARDRTRPVTDVSWFAARAYCVAQGKRLPTTVEWEYVASASRTRADAARDPQFRHEILAAYGARPRWPQPVHTAEANWYGVQGMHDRVWEWVEDFNSVLVSDDSRAGGARAHDLYCASGAIGAADPTNYPAFLRSALRAGLTPRTTLPTLGFRCAM